MSISKIIESLSGTIHRDAIATSPAQHATKAADFAQRNFPYVVTPQIHSFLSSHGITLPSHGHQSHPHPFHKIVEHYFLYNVLSNFVKLPTTVYFMKAEKFSKLSKHQPLFTRLQNAFYTVRDSARYEKQDLTPCRTPCVFFHDSLHYWSPSKLMHFFENNPNVTQVYASLVVPPELSISTELSGSFYPHLYRYYSAKGSLHYQLENSSDHYVQPSSSLEWLTLSAAQGPVPFYVEVLTSIASCHLLLITRNPPPVPQDSISFQIPDCVELPQPADFSIPIRDRLIPRSVYNNVFLYVRAVRTLRKTDPAGFVRTQMTKEEHSWVTNAAWDNLTTFILSTADQSFDPLYAYTLTWWQRLKYRFHHARGLKAASLWLSLQTALTYFSGGYHFLKSLITVPLHPPLILHLTLKQRLARASAVLSSFNLLAAIRIFKIKTIYPAPDALTPYPEILRTSRLTRILIGSSILVAPLAVTVLYYLRHHIPPAIYYAKYKSFFHDRTYHLRLNRAPAFFLPSHQPFGSLTLSLDQADNPSPSITSTPCHKLSPFDIDDEDSIILESPLHPSLTRKSPHPEPTSLLAFDSLDSSTPEPAFSTPFSGAHVHSPPTAEEPNPNPPPISPLQPEPQNPPAPENSQGSEPDNESSSSPPPVPEPKTPEPPSSQDRPKDFATPLETDPSASGPVLPWHTVNVTASDPATSFPSRQRSDPVLPPLPTSNICLFRALSILLNVTEEQIWFRLATSMPNSLLINSETQTNGFTTDHLAAVSYLFNTRFIVHSQNYPSFPIGPASSPVQCAIYHSPGHWSASPPLVGALPHPATERHTELEEALLSHKLPDGSLLPFLRFHDYQIDLSRAKKLASNMKNHFDGVLRELLSASPNILHAFDSIVDFAPSHSVRLCHLAGFAGCGKSRPIQSFFRGSEYSRELRVAVPNTDLRSHWKAQLRFPNSQSWRVSTWETSLLKHARILIIDEIYKMPPGFLDLALLLDPCVATVIILGDPLQGSYHSMHPDSSLRTLTPEIYHLRPYIDLYCAWTHRSPRNVAQVFDVTSLSPENGHVYHSRIFPNNLHILTASESASKTLSQGGCRAQTIASSQGLTLQHSGLHFDRSLFQVSPNITLVALTRHSRSITFLGDSDSLRRKYAFNPVLSAFHSGSVLPLSSWPELSGVELLRQPLFIRSPKLSGGVSLPLSRKSIFNDKPLPTSAEHDVIRSAPVLTIAGPDLIPNLPTTHLPETRRPLHFEIDSAIAPDSRPSPALPSLSPCEAVYPGIDSLLLFAHFIHEPIDPFPNERWHKDRLSRQFPDLLDFKEGTQPATLIAPWHQPAKDPTLLPLSISKRLRFRPSHHPYQHSDDDILLGTLLYQAWCQAFSLDPLETLPFDPILFAECINDNEFHQLSSKTKAVIQANASRSDPTWRHTVVKIFAKSQHKVNENSIFTSWKACQTLALAHDAVVLLLGPVKKYQRIIRDRKPHPHLFIYAGHTPQQMAEWAHSVFPPNRQTLCTCNDYTAFDQSQGGEAVIFEILKMKRVGIPQFFQDYHLWLKTNVQSQFGPLTCMRLTGEPGTYDDNTDYNIAVLWSRFQLNGYAVCVSGDDSAIVGCPPTSPTWPAVEKLLSLTFKIEVTPYPLFCGYLLGPAGALRSPRALFAKLFIAYNDESLPNKLASYLAEFAVGHSLGDSLWSLLPPDQVIYQAACFDFFCRFAPPHMKDVLKLGEPEPSLLSLVYSSIKHLSRPLWALLPTRVRLTLRHSIPAPTFFSEDTALASDSLYSPSTQLP
ncbi:replicase-associated protein [Culex originated Tymoviridae-like virus]|uniref:replicase-associated protein n=1 Tax=Culex originated Tymoviridae-like virus TaxID=1236047 RepID=UPI00028AF9D8|nr:replicase-associated protein [Culex originated Tymoviridae-like virus]AFT60444.1 replicase-associated protein [Culex originated Tymoviridae-like virus]